MSLSFIDAQHVVKFVIASEAKQSTVPQTKCGLLHRCAPRNDEN